MHRGMAISLRVLVTLVVVALAAGTVAYLFRDYLLHPWTRDGQVRAQILQIAPRISGPIVDLPIEDNRFVNKGELLFKIDPRTFQDAVGQARAEFKKAEASAAEARVEAERGRNIYQKDKGAIAELTVIQRENARASADAAVLGAKANLHAAELNLEFTEVRAPVDGYVTNLRLRCGSQTVANQPALALIDSHSFWVHGFFKETQISNIQKGDKVIVKLMAYPDLPLKGVVDSLGWGIAQQDGSPGVDLLPAISPSFDWIRLAQRIPVRVQLTDVPKGVELRVGTTASVFVMTE